MLMKNDLQKLKKKDIEELYKLIQDAKRRLSGVAQAK